MIDTVFALLKKKKKKTTMDANTEVSSQLAGTQ
jgi:hypothetical protein